MKSMRIVILIQTFLAVFLGIFFAFPPHVVVAQQCSQLPILKIEDTGRVVARVYFADRNDLNRLAGSLDVWEVHHGEGYLVASLRFHQHITLLQQGYRIEVDDEKTIVVNQMLKYLPSQVGGIPGYSCYRTVEEINSALHNLSLQYPNLVSYADIGDSWEKTMEGGTAGYDIFVMVLTNEKTRGPKPRFFLMGGIHGREYVTSETVLRFAEHLLSNYGTDPDITWLLDFFELHALPMTNPDGRKQAETGIWWRKNTDNDDGCNNSNDWGTDLNRNHTFKWACCEGSSGEPCNENYRGSKAGSEPEVKALEGYIAAIFDDQKGPADTDPAPDDATGLFITLHSYGELILWPWGWTEAMPPNALQLQTLAEKLAYFNNYSPHQSYDLYITDGSTDDWAYGQLGVAAYTFEMGTEFAQECSPFEDTIYPQNRDALIYAFKASRRPYQTPAGPDSIDIELSRADVVSGNIVTITATANGSRYSVGRSTALDQNIAAARYTVDTPSWVAGTITYPMVAADGAFDDTIENIFSTIDTKGWTVGRHTIFVESQDEEGNWGVPTAIFLNIDKNLPNQTKVRVVPARVSFGSIKKGVTSEPKSITIMNVGSNDLEITSIEIAGLNQSDFLLDHDCIGQVHPGNSCTITIAVHPSEFGKRKTDLVIALNGTIKSVRNVHLAANAKPPKLLAKPRALSFGNLPVAQSLTTIIDLTNHGISDLEIYGVAIEDDLEDNFSYMNSCGVIPQEGHCSIDITFHPQSIGKKSGLLKIFTNEPAHQIRSIRLKGSGKYS